MQQRQLGIKIEIPAGAGSSRAMNNLLTAAQAASDSNQEPKVVSIESDAEISNAEYNRLIADFQGAGRTPEEIDGLVGGLQVMEVTDEEFDELIADLRIAETYYQTSLRAARHFLRGFLNDKIATELDLSFRDIETLPGAYFALPEVKHRLVTLDLHHNNLTRLPKELESCVRLEVMNCAGNPLS
jgi:hypothetical protein